MQITKLRSLCKTLGGDLVELTSKQFDHKHSKTFYECPFARAQLGLDFSKKHVLYTTEHVPPEWPEIIHEMGHVFASKKAPPFSDEWSFLGWEYATCLHLCGDVEVWKRNMSDYNVEHVDFGSLSPRKQNALLVERLTCAKRVGLVSPAGVPLTVRPTAHIVRG